SGLKILKNKTTIINRKIMRTIKANRLSELYAKLQEEEFFKRIWKKKSKLLVRELREKENRRFSIEGKMNPSERQLLNMLRDATKMEPSCLYQDNKLTFITSTGNPFIEQHIDCSGNNIVNHFHYNIPEVWESFMTN